MRNSKILKNRTAFSADTEDIPVSANNIEAFLLGIDLASGAGGAMTLATQLAVINEVKITVGGEIVSLMKFIDLFMLQFSAYPNIMKFESIPYYLVTGAASNYGNIGGVILPLKVTTDKQSYIKATFATQTNLASANISITALYGDKPQSGKPISIKYVGDTTVSGVFKEVDMSQAGRQLKGLLIYATTIPVTASAPTCTVGELKILSKRVEKMHVNWFNLPALEVEKDSGIGALASNFRYLDLSDDTIPADELKVGVTALGALSDAFRLVGIYE